MLSKTIPDVCPNIFQCPQVFPTHLQCSLLISDAPYVFPANPVLLGFPEHTTHARSLPIRALLALPLS